MTCDIRTCVFILCVCNKLLYRLYLGLFTGYCFLSGCTTVPHIDIIVLFLHSNNLPGVSKFIDLFWENSLIRVKIKKERGTRACVISYNTMYGRPEGVNFTTLRSWSCLHKIKLKKMKIDY